MKKKYKVTDELVGKMTAANAHERLRDIYVKLPFMHKRAVKSAVEAEKLKDDFWYGVHELYPNLQGNVVYEHGTHTLSIEEG